MEINRYRISYIEKTLFSSLNNNEKDQLNLMKDALNHNLSDLKNLKP